MNWNATAAIAPVSTPGIGDDDLVAPTITPRAADAATAAPGVDFGRLVGEGLGQLNGQLIASQVGLQRLATGEVQNLHQLMIDLEETRMSFQLFLQVRNRALEAYQDLMKMQI